jgi:hypothetical protein
MKYITILWVSILSGTIEGAGGGIAFNSAAECEAAMPEVWALTHDQYDATMTCEVTNVASGSIRPRRNPKGE